MDEGDGSRRQDILIRLCGVALAAAAVLALRTLAALPLDPDEPSAAALALAAFGFVGASLGTALLVLGSHVRDRVRVSSPWIDREVLREKRGE